jgi:uncharacterized protein (TIGR02646 family)
MIRIYKDLTAVPASLLVGKKDTTKKHWDKVILSNAWEDSGRYKEADIKAVLKLIYNNKCAFCEKTQLDSFAQVEHFRPKDIYYWLGFSWDNLLWACPQCNISKSTNFAIRGILATYAREPFAAIHGLTAAYDISEQPLFFNPETADPERDLQFDRSGEISAINPQLVYTIDTCKLNRDELIQCRMTIFNIIRHCATFLDFKNKIFDGLIRLVVEEKIRRNSDYNTIFS